jgi:UDP-N-acetylmuramate-alanine ligase
LLAGERANRKGNNLRENMHIHILGICGTFMGSLAQLAKQLGHTVSGCDANVYPPMSTQLEMAGIDLIEGFDPQQLVPAPDLIIVGNALSRGNPCVEYMLDQGLPYTSGSAMLCGAINMCWRYQVLMARRRPAACWQKFLITRA